MSSIGEILQEARQKKGVSRETAARTLKIKIDRLTDLEEGRYDEFPAQVYARSFLRLYAEYLALDGDAILKRFVEENPPAETKPVFEITEEQRTKSKPIQRHIPIQSASFLLTATGKTVFLAALILLGLLAGVFWWLSKARAGVESERTFPAIHETAPGSASPSHGEAANGWSESVATPPLTLSTNTPPADARRNP